MIDETLLVERIGSLRARMEEMTVNYDPIEAHDVILRAEGGMRILDSLSESIRDGRLSPQAPVRRTSGTQRLARNTDPDTSHLAAMLTSRSFDEHVKSRILQEFTLTQEGFTDDELLNQMRSRYPENDYSESSVRKRRADLMRENFLFDTGQKRTSNHNRQMIVWGLAQNWRTR